MFLSKKELGAKGEEIAARLYEQRGYRILARNAHEGVGEIDIIALKNGVVHVVEVKTRRGSHFGFGEQAVSRAKLLRMQKSASLFMRKSGVQTSRVEYDVVAIHMTTHEYRVRWYRNVSLEDMG